MKDITTTVRIPHEMWRQIRRLQEEGKVGSIREAVIKGLTLFIGRNHKKGEYHAKEKSN